MRIILALASGAMLAAIAATAQAETPPAHTEPATTLRNAVRVEGAQIRLGDLFDHAGPHAEDVVATAPPPGASLLFEAPWLTSMARSYGLGWQPPSSQTAIRVQRASHTVDNTELAERVAQLLGAASAKSKIVFDTQYRIDIAVGDPPGYGIDHLELNQPTSRFTAEIHVPADDQASQPTRISGRVVAMIDVPVLTHPMAPGEMLSTADVTWTQVASAAFPSGDIMDVQELVGRTPRHPLPAGQPLRATDLQVPVVIKRNEPVLIVLERPGLYLTAEGKALEDGGQGALIHVVNIQSNRTIDAVVLGSGQVAVRAPGVQQAAIR